MLHLQNLDKRFGGVHALEDVSISFGPGEFTGLIGPNGSGKTTLLNCVCGLYAPDSGRIRYRERVISTMRPHEVFKLGIGRTFQISKVFHRLTVLDNLKIPALTEGKLSRQEISRRSADILKSIRMEALGNSPAGSLSGGQKKLLEIGMIMMIDPDLLLLDEPFGGVHPELKAQLESYLHLLHGSGKTIILVSHEIPSLFRLCTRLIVLDHGMLIMEGEPEAVRGDQRVIDAYLGGAQ